MDSPSPFLQLQSRAARHLVPSGFRVVLPGDPGYDAARQISNSRFDLSPVAVAFPRSAEHVAECIRFCQDQGVALRVRSGGHQHEGMSSGNGVLVVRLSEMNQIQFTDGTMQTAWIQTGARLEDVYAELARYGKIIPGGGCKGVNVGGLTLGGGWGLSARQYGLACDNVLEVEIVLADGRIARATADNELQDLFWALLGSGGGNFGIVTRFRFRLSSLGPGRQLQQYRVYWEASRRREVIRRWLAYQRAGQRRETTSYLVLYADFEEHSWSKPPVYAGGMSYADKDALQQEVDSWSKALSPTVGPKYNAWPRKPEKTVAVSAETSGLGASEAPQLLDAFLDFPGWIQTDHEGPLGRTGGLGSGAFEADSPKNECSTEHCKKAPFPMENCLAPHPHKVSSAFPVDHDGDEDAFEVRFAEAVSAFIESRPVDLNVKSYISLYSMGGAIADIAPDESAFWYRKKPFVIQIESWWNYPDPELKKCRDKKDWQKPYKKWVQDFRRALSDEGLIEGAFINFIDRDVPLYEYYGGNFERLKRLKARWDPTDFFSFEMSIPPAES